MAARFAGTRQAGILFTPLVFPCLDKVSTSSTYQLDIHRPARAGAEHRRGFYLKEIKMSDIYHPHSEKGGGLRIAKITDKNGQVVKLERLDEQLYAAQIIQAQVLLGASREEAEAIAAEAILERRKARQWFGQ